MLEVSLGLSGHLIELVGYLGKVRVHLVLDHIELLRLAKDVLGQLLNLILKSLYLGVLGEDLLGVRLKRLNDY